MKRRQVATVVAVVASLSGVACDAVKREAAEMQERLRRDRDAGAGSSAAVEPEDVFDDAPATAGAPGLRAGRYRLDAVGVTVTRRNSAGQAWDLVGGAGPDPELTVTINGRRVAACPATTDVTRVMCPVDVLFELTATTEIALMVVDDDLTGDQPIGRAVSADLTRTGRVGAPFKLAPHGQVTSAVIEVTAVAPPPSAWTRHRGLVLGLAIGLGVGALMALLFRAALLTRTMVLPSTLSTSDWSCAFCSRSNLGGAARCGECGAQRKKARARDGDATIRPDADRAFGLAMIAAVLGAALSVFIAARGMQLDPGLPSAVGAAGFALAIAGWIHERSWRARTGEALLATLAVVALGPILGQFLLVSLVIAGGIGVVMLLFWFSD